MSQRSDEPETPWFSLVVVTRLSPTTQPSVYLFSWSVDLCLLRRHIIIFSFGDGFNMLLLPRVFASLTECP